VKDLLVLVERVLPAGPEDWELIARLHSSKYPNHLRDGKKLKQKFYEHANKKPQTGNPNISYTDLEASRLKQLINSKVGSTSNFTVDNDAFVERTDANFEELLNEALTETSASPGDTSSALLLHTEMAVTNEAAVRAQTDEVTSVAVSARAQAHKDEVATVASNAWKNKSNAVKEAVEKSSGDMAGIMKQLMIQRLLQSQEDAAERREEKRHEQKREDREHHREEHRDKQWDRMFGLVAGGIAAYFSTSTERLQIQLPFPQTSVNNSSSGDSSHTSSNNGKKKRSKHLTNNYKIVTSLFDLVLLIDYLSLQSNA
jgi:hypothetical protein